MPSFSHVGPAAGRGAAISESTGSPDLSFPKVNGNIRAGAPDGSGRWYIGGEFTYVGGVARNRIAHIKSDKTVDSWNPNASGTVYSLAVSGSTVYAGGYFTSTSGVYFYRLQAGNFMAVVYTAPGLSADRQVI